MLGKLLKYEFKATARMFLLMYAALLVVAGINALVLPFSDLAIGFAEAFPILYSTVSSLSMLTYVLVITAVVVLTFVIIVVRFYRMLGDQGYLWFTLPVTSAQHIWSKLICAFVWSVASTVMVGISIGLMLLPLGWTSELYQLVDFWREAVMHGFSPGLWLACGIVLRIVSWLSSVLMFFVSIAIGPNLIKSRLGGSVLTYIIIYVATQILGSIQMLIIAKPLSDYLNLMLLFVYEPVTLETTAAASNSFILMCTAVFGIGFLALSVAYYFLTRYFMTKKLNLA